MQLMSDEVTPITFDRELACGMADCGSQTRLGLLERDERLPGLWRLLPICPRCLQGLRAGSRQRHPSA